MQGTFQDITLDAWLTMWEDLERQGLTPDAALRKTLENAPTAMRPRLEQAVARLQSLDRMLDRLPPNPASEPIAPVVAGYEVLEVLGRGGMGLVYKAREVKLGRLVALKMLRGDNFPTADQQERLREEARVIARLQHPHIVQIFEVGGENRQSYLALEYLEGGTLAQKLVNHPLPAEEAARLTETLARAVQAVHAQGIIHRDLKPGNILLAADGTPKVSDFGLAKFFQLSPDAPNAPTQSGAVVGTPSYMAPEQAWGQSARIGPATDVYGLGAMLYEMLTGRPPFKGATVLDTLDQVARYEPLPPSRLQPSVPRDLETIGLKCLLKDPARRYPSAEALADDLRRFLEHKPIAARPTPWWQRLGKWARRRPAAAALLAVTFLGLAAMALLLAQGHALNQDLRAERDKTLNLNQKLQSEREQTQASLLIHSQETYALADKLVHLGRPGEAEKTFRRILPRARALARDFPRESEHKRLLAFSLHMLGRSLQVQDDSHEELEPLYREAISLFRELLDQTPEDAEARMLLANTYNNLAILLTTLAQKEESRWRHAEEAVDEAITLMTALTVQYPDHPHYQGFLGNCLNTKASLYQQQNKAWESARDLLTRALEHQHRALKKDKDNGEFLSYLRMHHTNLCLTLLRLRDIRGAAHQATLLHDGARGLPEARFKAVELLAGCCSEVALDKTLNEADQRKWFDVWGSLAVQILRRLKEDGFFDTPQSRENLKTNPSLNGLRFRSDFHKLLTTLAP